MGLRPSHTRLVDSMEIHELQETMRATYVERDVACGGDAMFRWLTLAWLASLANLEGVDLEEAAARYAHGCPRCGMLPCGCEPR
jgi:hypothetical protein